jgi:hypothetical protein
MDPDLEIEVNVHISSKVLPLRVRQVDSVATILSKLGAPRDCTLVHDSLILCPGFSFAFLGITDGAHVYSMPKEGPRPPAAAPQPDPGAPARICKREQLTKLFSELQGPDYDRELCDAAWGSRSPWILSEAAKIKDRFFDRVEGSVRCHRKLLRELFGRRPTAPSGDAKVDDKRKK